MCIRDRIKIAAPQGVEFPGAAGKIENAVCLPYSERAPESRDAAVSYTHLDVYKRQVVRRGKNSTKATVAKHATPQEYRASTALESLFGWLYLQNRGARIEDCLLYTSRCV